MSLYLKFYTKKISGSNRPQKISKMSAIGLMEGRGKGGIFQKCLELKRMSQFIKGVCEVTWIGVWPFEPVISVYKYTAYV